MPNELEYLHGVDETQVHDFCNPVRYCGSCGALIKKDSKICPECKTEYR